jgi:hypothetical protein
MRNAIRWLPAFVGTFALGTYVGSPTCAAATTTARAYVGGAVVGLVLVATLLLCIATRGKKDNQQSGGFGYAARTRTGRN